MKILTWNINGIRASKVPLKQLFDSLDADIICLQETKVTRDMLDERSAIVDGFSSYYSFSSARTGYSGVATYVSESVTPVRAEQGLSGNLTVDDDSAIGHYGDLTDFTEEELELLDREGRTIITQHQFVDTEGAQQLLTVINVYCPRADPEREDRKTFKLRFYQLLQTRAEALLRSGSYVIILGDVNTSHQRIDTCDPSEPAEFVKNPCRIWLNQILWTPEHKQAGHNLDGGGDNEDGQTKPKSKPRKHAKNTKNSTNETEDEKQIVEVPVGCSGQQFVDSFRYFHAHRTEAYTCWNTMIGARETNYGTRIDYIFVDKTLAQAQLKDCDIMPEVMGSDHCPVKAHLNIEIKAAKKCPPLCTKYFPEFTGVQTKLSAFFTKGVKRQASDTEPEMSGSQDSKPSAVIGRTESSVKHTTHQQARPLTKKAKTDKPALGKKQSSLASFFGAKPLVNKTNSCQTPPGEDKNSAETPQADSKNRTTDSSQSKSTEHTESNGKSANSSKGNSSSAWRSLLKGPPPAPLCKGHKEPCLLRTVKKDDSLNKGRQFYVCPRPEGHKSNPQARCDHFEWVEKKKKPKP